MNFYLELRKLNRQRNIKTKALKKKLKIFFLKLFYRKKSTFIKNDYKNICIFMHSQAIGDAIVTSGIIKALRDNDFKVYVIIPPKISFLFIDMIKIDGFFIYQKNDFKKIRKLLKFNIDLVIDLADFDTFSYYRLKTLSYIKPKHAISFNQPQNTIFDTNIITHKSEHITTRMISIIKFFSIDSKCQPYLTFNEHYVYDAYIFSQQIKMKNEKIIIFNPFASQRNRSLSTNQINIILTYLNTLVGYKTIVFNLGNEINNRLMKSIEINPFEDAERSFALVQYADIVITVDTAVVHLASALNKRQFCIYNNRLFNSVFENNIVWGPNSNKATQLTTTQFLKTEIGDDITSFDTSILIKALRKELNKIQEFRS